MNRITSIDYKPIHIRKSTEQELAAKHPEFASWAISINGITPTTTEITVFGRINYILSKSKETIEIDGNTIFQIDIPNKGFLNLSKDSVEALLITHLLHDFHGQCRGYAYWSIRNREDFSSALLPLPDIHEMRNDILELFSSDSVSFRQQFG